MKSVKELFKYFPDNKNAFITYSFASFIAGLLELMGVALTYPFVICLLQKKEIIFFNKPFSAIEIGIFITGLFLIKNLLMIMYIYAQLKLTKKIQCEINVKFMQYFLSGTYLKISKISLERKMNLFSYIIPNVINNYLLRIQNLAVNLFIFLFIILYIFIKFPIPTIVTFICAFIFVLVQNIILKPILNKLGKENAEFSKISFKETNQVIINLKSVKISNNESFFFENYKNAISKYLYNLAKVDFQTMVPPYITEPFIIILLFIMLAIITYQNYSAPDILVASFASVATAIFRLAPTISRIQTNLNGINSSSPIVKKFLEKCQEFKINDLRKIEEKSFSEFNSTLELKNINFEYQINKPILKNINLQIKKGEFLGIAGNSGAGKTTLIDIIAGLLVINNGEILVDGQKNDKCLKIGYIPQEYMIIPGSIKDNVTFGHKNIDEKRVIEVLKQAQLYDFIINNYANGIEANPFTDSNGFSVGQKQRLAIARALYPNPDIIILDEATSSLDLKTENEFCNVLSSLKGEKTIIAIAHRLSTIKSADRIAYINNGTIENIAPFDELVKINQSFNELVKLSDINKL